MACAAIGAVREVAGHLLLRRLDSDDLRDEIGSAIPGRLTLKCRSPFAVMLLLAAVAGAAASGRAPRAHSASGMLCSDNCTGRRLLRPQCKQDRWW